MSINVSRLEPKPHSLEEIFADDDLGLLDDVKARRPSMTKDQKLQHSADEIEDFIRSKQRLPDADSADFTEKKLGRRLQALESRQPDKAQAYQQLCAELCRDSAKLEAVSRLNQEPLGKEYASLEDIFDDDDDLGLFEGTEKAIELETLPEGHLEPTGAVEKRRGPRFISHGEPCRSFFNYEDLFKQANELIRSHDLKIVPVKGYRYDLRPGLFFYLNGLMVLVAECDYENAVKENNKNNFKVRLIYANETESSPLNYSFLNAMNKYGNSYQVMAVTEKGENFYKQAEHKVNALRSMSAAEPSGYLYVLKTLSRNETILKFLQSSELVKIGFCTTTVEERIRGAQNDPTYLYAPVEIVCAYRCFDFDPHQFERLVHAILWEHRFNVTLTDAQGHQFQPREWFTVSAQTACEVVERILNNTIKDYRVDAVSGRLVKIAKAPS